MPSGMPITIYYNLLPSFFTFIVSISVKTITLAHMLYSLVRVTRRDKKGKLKSR